MSYDDDDDDDDAGPIVR